MFHHILIPVDFAPTNQRVLKVASNIAPSARVTLLHVIERIHGLDDDAFYDKLESLADSNMKPLHDLCKELDLDATGVINYGKRTSTILEFIQDSDIDLILMDSHRIDPSDPAMGLGTISHKVAIAAPCPVMLVK